MNTYECVKRYLRYRELTLQNGGRKVYYLQNRTTMGRHVIPYGADIERHVIERSEISIADRNAADIIEFNGILHVLNFSGNILDNVVIYNAAGGQDEYNFIIDNVPDVLDAPVSVAAPAVPERIPCIVPAINITSADNTRGFNVKKVFSSFTQYGIPGLGRDPDPSACTSIAVLSIPILLGLCNFRKFDEINTELVNYLMYSGSKAHTIAKVVMPHRGVGRGVEHFDINEATRMHYRKDVELFTCYPNSGMNTAMGLKSFDELIATAPIDNPDYFACISTGQGETRLLILSKQNHLPCLLFDSHGSGPRNDGNGNAYIWIFNNVPELLNYYTAKYIAPLLEIDDVEYGQCDIGFIQKL